MDVLKAKKFFSPYSEANDKDFGYKIGIYIIYLMVLFTGTGIFGDFIGIGTNEAILIYKRTSFIIVGLFAIQRIRYLKISFWWILPAITSDIFVQIIYLISLFISGNILLKDWLNYTTTYCAGPANTLVPRTSFKEYRKNIKNVPIKEEEMDVEKTLQPVQVNNMHTQSKSDNVVKTNIARSNNSESELSEVMDAFPSIQKGLYVSLLVLLLISILPVGFVSIAIMSGMANGGGGGDIITGILLFYIGAFFFLALGRLKDARKPLHLSLILFIPIFPFVQIGFLIYLATI